MPVKNQQLGPPDGGWGWVVVVSIFCTNVLSHGAILCIGIVFEDIMKEFNSSTSEVSAMASICFSLQCLCAPAVSLIHDRYGTRKVVFAGCFCISLAFTLSALAPNMLFLYFSFGILGGIGMTLQYLPTMVLISYYFDKKISKATAIALVGVFVGCFLHPFVMRFLMTVYNWRGALIITGALSFNSLVASLLLRPVEYAKLPESNSDPENFVAAADKKQGQLQKLADDVNCDLATNPKCKQIAASHQVLSNELKLPLTTYRSLSAADIHKLTFCQFTPSQFAQPTQCPLGESQLGVSGLDSVHETSEAVSTRLSVLAPYIENMKNPHVACFVLGNLLMSFVYWVPSVFIVDWGATLGIDPTLRTAILSLCGLGNIIGRPFIAVFADWMVNCRTLFFASLVALAGLLTVVLSCFPNMFTLAVIAFQYAGLIGSTQSLLTSVLATLVPLSQIGSVLSVVLAAEGIGILCGPPLLALLPNYQVLFVTSGAMLLVASVVFSAPRLLPCLGSQTKSP